MTGTAEYGNAYYVDHSLARYQALNMPPNMDDPGSFYYDNSTGYAGLNQTAEPDYDYAAVGECAYYTLRSTVSNY